MIKTGQIKEILSLYTKHGWKLRRVLLCNDLRINLTPEDLSTLFSEAEISESDINAVWFSRESKRENIAWELRYLSENPYAILELISKDDDENTAQLKLKNVETRMRDYASKHKSGGNG